MTWYALQHKPAQGDRALAHLQNQDIACFYPKITVEKIKAGKRTKKLEPLFPGYLFVNLEQTDPMWAKLRSTRGVIRIVSFANKPASIPDEVIQHIKASLDTVAEQGSIKPGQAVELDEGPFKGISAIFQAYDGEERAIVLISFMQKQQTVKVPLSTLGSRDSRRSD
ncbi:MULTISPECIES: transcription/translation regulatory transformer protein RfaH [Marinobacter]|uniref:transcription/translation regulatory transformer protein RfaH n=1 Tax=Marinobacter TaxID=2742 RepID=UPI001247B029|nr:MULTISPECIES: transcription/translation regulatory transformer protein RfaH [Marinobacter]MBL3554933.1 transcription/translation regulatory transformer protein RfaH [Marinobacter sp. JB05H06]